MCIRDRFQVHGTKRFKRTVESADRLGLKPRQLSHVLNSYLEDTQAVNEGDRSKLIDSRKIERDLNKVRLEKIDNQRGLVLKGLGFDGKTDLTRFKNGDNKEIEAKKVENITVVSEPGAKYLGHAPTPPASGLAIKNSIFSFLDKRGIIFRETLELGQPYGCLLYTSPSPRDS